MKTYIATKFNVKFSQEDNGWEVGYDFASNNKMSFAIITTKNLKNYDENISNHLEFFVAFNKDAIRDRLINYYSYD